MRRHMKFLLSGGLITAPCKLKRVIKIFDIFIALKTKFALI